MPTLGHRAPVEMVYGLEGVPVAMPTNVQAQSRLLRITAANEVDPTWTALRDAINYWCFNWSPQLAVGKDEEIAGVQAGCYRYQPVEDAVLRVVSYHGTWISHVNTFLAMRGDALRKSYPDEFAKLTGEFDRITKRRGLVLHMTLQDPWHVFFDTLPEEFRKQFDIPPPPWDWPWTTIGLIAGGLVVGGVVLNRLIP